VHPYMLKRGLGGLLPPLSDLDFGFTLLLEVNKTPKKDP